MFLLFKILDFLLSIVFNLFCLLTLTRLYMQWAKVSFANPIGQLVIKLTNWIVLPLEKTTPKIRKIDLASLIASYICSFVYTLLIVLIGFWTMYGSQQFTWQVIGLIALGAVLNLIKLLTYLLSAMIIIQVILSWVKPSSPGAWFIFAFTQQMSAPLLNPIKKIAPIMNGLDFSPFIALLLLQLISIVINHFIA